MDKISDIPDDRIKEVQAFVDFILSQSNTIPTKRDSLHRIWKNKDLEKITDLEGELKAIRREMTESILRVKV